MTQPMRQSGLRSGQVVQPGSSSGANLADILERVLDKGIVIAGDIQINLLDIELLTIKLRLLVASVDKAKEMGIDWWEHDPTLSSRSAGGENGQRSIEAGSTRTDELEAENEDLRQRVAALEAAQRPKLRARQASADGDSKSPSAGKRRATPKRRVRES